ncbi:endophilin-A3b isoform X2 [Betta splendens]|uniref:Endophilin-A3b isoform X2 n=1 Tax=Betta splendens TaxID=158456 RepID=A0A6P7MNR2_BETSP|nr:endophilin-A3b isoform X2 [Betta splendens]
MSVSGMKKQLHKASQLLNERLMGAEGTKMDEDFVRMEKSVSAIQTLLLELLSRTTQFLQPNPAHRAKPSMLNTVSRIRGQGTSAGYPQAEEVLGGRMVLSSQRFGPASEFGAALARVGEALQQVGRARDAMDTNVQCNFVDPLQDLHSTQLRDNRFQLKKLHSRRLDFDYKKRQRGSMPAEEVRRAWDKLVTSKEQAERSMFVLLHNDMDLICCLAALVSALLNFPRDAHRTLLDLQDHLQARLTAASNKAEQGFRRRKIRVRGEWTSGVRFLQPPPASSSVVPSRPGSPVSVHPDSQLILDQPCCRALYSFRPNQDSELSFSEGDVIVLSCQVDANWYQGELHGRSGLFPVSYVDVLVPLPLP